MKLSRLMLLFHCHICVFPLDKSTDVMSAWCFIVHCDPVAESFICQQMFLYIYCMLCLDPGLRFAQPRLQCLREHLTQIRLAAQSFQLSENIWMLVHKRPVYLYLCTSLAQCPSRAGCPLQLIFTIYVSSQQWRSCYLVNVARITSQDLPLFARI